MCFTIHNVHLQKAVSFFFYSFFFWTKYHVKVELWSFDCFSDLIESNFKLFMLCHCMYSVQEVTIRILNFIFKLHFKTKSTKWTLCHTISSDAFSWIKEFYDSTIQNKVHWNLSFFLTLSKSNLWMQFCEDKMGKKIFAIYIFQSPITFFVAVVPNMLTLSIIRLV